MTPCVCVQFSHSWKFSLYMLEEAFRRVPADQAVKTMQNLYPERMGMCLLINAPPTVEIADS
ncbi:hypothetical protein T484DRAFT_1868813 [Baffinella frigidus]|nr:hypothetical protein T484DRAFT_1868813 [Cryptophyta sp. CCMP2293]